MNNGQQFRPVPGVLGDSGPAQATPLAAFDREDLIERMMGSDGLARQIVDSFIKYIPRQLAALAEAIERSNTEQTRALAHKIKGSAANVSAVALAQAASVIEVAARRGDLTGVLKGFSELCVECERTRSELANFLTSPVAPASVL